MSSHLYAIIKPTLYIQILLMGLLTLSMYPCHDKKLLCNICFRLLTSRLRLDSYWTKLLSYLMKFLKFYVSGIREWGLGQKPVDVISACTSSIKQFNLQCSSITFSALPAWCMVLVLPFANSWQSYGFIIFPFCCVFFSGWI